MFEQNSHFPFSQDSDGIRPNMTSNANSNLHSLQQQCKLLFQRIQKLNVDFQDLPFHQEFEALQLSLEIGQPDAELLQYLSEQVAALESSLLKSKFISPAHALEGNSFIGNALETQVPVNISIGEHGNPTTVQHILLAGAVASGKTTAIASLADQLKDHAYVVIVDSVNSMSKIPSLREHFDWADIRDIRFHTLNKIPNLPPNEQEQIFIRGFAETYDMVMAQQEVFLAIKELEDKARHPLRFQKDNRSGTGNDNWMLDPYTLNDYLKHKKYSGNTNRLRFRDTFVLHHTFFLDGVFPMMTCRRGMDLFAILTRGNLVLSLQSILPIHRAYIIRMLVDYLYLMFRSGRRAASGKPIVILIDEAQHLLEHDNGQLTEMLLQVRHYGNLHFVLGVQHPASLKPHVFSAVDCMMIFPLRGEKDVWQMSQILHLKDSTQIAYLSRQNFRQPVFYFPKAFKTLFIVDVPFIEVEEQTRVMQTASWIKSMPWEPLEGFESIKGCEDLNRKQTARPSDEARMKAQQSGERSERTGRNSASGNSENISAETLGKAGIEDLGQDEMRILLHVALRPERVLMEIYADLDIHPAKAKRAIEHLEALNFVKTEKFSRVDKGGAPTCLQILPSGEAFLKARGIEPAEKLLKKGGYRHDIAMRFLRNFYLRQGFKGFKFDKQFGEKQFDALAKDPEDRIWGFEVFTSGSVQTVAKSALRGASTEGIYNVVVACETRPMIESVAKALTAIDGGQCLTEKIELKLTAEFSPV